MLKSLSRSSYLRVLALSSLLLVILLTSWSGRNAPLIKEFSQIERPFNSNFREARVLQINGSENSVKQDQSPVDEASNDSDDRWAEKSQPFNVNRVLIIGYMRGGSSLLGELFNRHPSSSLYWFEPVDSFYSAHFGIRPLNVPLTLINYPSPQLRVALGDKSIFAGYLRYRGLTNHPLEPLTLSARNPNATERTALNDFLASMLSCDLHRLPVETFLHTFFPRSSFFYETITCLKSFDAARKEAVRCRNLIGRWCGGQSRGVRANMEVTDRRQCSEVINYFRTKRPTSLTRQTIDELMSVVPGAFFDERDHGVVGNTGSNQAVSGKRWPPFNALLASNESSLPSEAGANLFFEHFRCIDQLNKTIFATCIKPAELTCRSKANVVAVKAIRVRMSDIEPLLSRFPDIHVIHYVRDPRAVALSRVDTGLALLTVPNESRSRFQSKFADTMVDRLKARKETALITESKYLCHRMLSDIRARQLLDVRYPGTVSVIRYEDLIMNPEREVTELFRRVGAAEPDEDFLQWLRETMFGGKEGKRFEIRRANASVTAEKWKRQVGRRAIVHMNRHCGRVLAELGYEV